MIGELIEWVRTTDDDAEIAEARAELGGGDITTSVDYQPVGHDSQPLPGDYLLLVPGPESGSYLVAGYVDPNNAGTAEPGEVRLYARDGGGAVVGSLLLTQGGEVHLAQDTAAALIARADRVDAMLKAVFDALETGRDEAVSSTPGDGGKVAFTKAALALDEALVPTGCDKVYGT